MLPSRCPRPDPEDPTVSHPGLPHDAVLYPSSDGQPMAESDIHRRCMTYLIDALARHFEKRGSGDVYPSRF